MAEEVADRRSRVAEVSRGLRPAAGHLLLLACALSIILIPLAQRELFAFRDHTDYFQPLRWFTAAQLGAGKLPLWNPYNASGEPWLANPQTGVFYPPAWLFVALPFDVAYNLFLFLHLAILGTGAFRLFSRFAARAPALAGAVALTLAGPVLSLLDVQNNLATFAWMPWALARALDDRKTPRPIRSAMVLAMAFLAGEPFFAAIVAAMYALLVRRVRTIAVVAAFAFGFSAVQLLPFLDLLRISDRAMGFAESDILRDSVPLRDWLRIAVPPDSVYDARLGQHFIPIVYVGIVVVILAVAGAVVSVWRRRLGGVLLLSLLAITILIASGPRFLAELPITLFRYPARLMPFGAFAIAGLAALGLDRLPRRRWLDALVIVIIAVDLRLAARPLLRSEPFRTDRVPYDASIGRDGKIVRLHRDKARGGERELWISGYLNLYQRRFDTWTAAPLSLELGVWHFDGIIRSIDIARESAVGYVLAPGIVEGFVPIVRAKDVLVQRNPRALPLAYLRENDGRLRNVLAFAHAPDHAYVGALSSQGGVVVLTQVDAPGWRVEVDGKKAEKLRIHDTLRGVRIGPGRHEVRWIYRPLSLIFGASLTSLAIVFACVVSIRLSRT